MTDIDYENLKKRVFKLIDEKKKAMISFSNNHLDLVKQDISMLNGFINGDLYLNSKDIEDLLSNLVQYRVCLDIPLDEGIFIARAVKIDDAKTYPIYDDVCRLSYIPLHLKDKAQLGRFNNKSETIYYGCIFKNYDDINVPYHEIIVKDSDYTNLLISRIKEKLNVRFIGLFSYLERNEIPFVVHSLFHEVEKHYEETHEKDLLDCIKKIDDFFRDIITKDGNERVYLVTSVLGKIYLENDSTDGLIYLSVKADETQNIVVKPISIDKKIEHLEVKITLSKIDSDGTTFDAREINSGKILNSKINWKK